MRFDRVAYDATIHCLTGCAIGEVGGMVLSSVWGIGNAQSIGLATVLAFFFGYAFTFVPLIAGGMGVAAALRIAIGGDTVSIAVMELTDNAVVLAIPGAMNAGLGDALFWGSLALSLVLAFVAAYPVNVWLVATGRRSHGAHAHHQP